MTKIVSMLLAAVVSMTAAAINGTENGANVNALHDKSIAFIGDSISYGTNYHGGYGKLIGEICGMNVTNPSAGGAALARNVKWSSDADGIRPCIIDMTEKLTDEYDYIIIEGGINDFWNHAPLGALTEGFDGDYDETTTAGALESIFSRVKTAHPESKTGYVIIHDPFTYDAEEAFEPYYELIKAACAKWEIPYLDLYEKNNKETGVNVRDAEQKKKYFSASDRPEGDGTHPNEEGYMEIYVTPMIPWLMSL